MSTDVDLDVDPHEAEVEAPAEAPKKAKVPVDITAFIAVVTDAVQGADPDTGTISDVAALEVRKSYQELPGTANKSAGRKYVNENIIAAMTAFDITTARAYLECQNSIQIKMASSTADKAITPEARTKIFVDRVVALRVASECITDNPPEGISDDWSHKVEEKFTELLEAVRIENKDAPSGRADVALVNKFLNLKNTRAASSSDPAKAVYSGPRRDVGMHIKEVLAKYPEGTFLTIAQIHAESSSQYGPNEVSLGALNSRLFPVTRVSTIAGVEPVLEGGKKGAVLI